jgi:hypothetical protein
MIKREFYTLLTVVFEQSRNLNWSYNQNNINKNIAQAKQYTPEQNLFE